jgi:hypothetical protein
MSRSALARQLQRQLREGGGALPAAVADPFSVVDDAEPQEEAAGELGLKM